MALSRGGRQAALRLARGLLDQGRCGSGVSGAARALSTAAPSTSGDAAAGPSPTRRGAWWAAAAALLGATGAAAAQADHPPPPHAEQSFHLVGLQQRRRAFFKYEKRIRELSAPEKVFEYFSSLGSPNAGFAMTPSDAMRSVVPVYPPYDSDVIRAGSLPGEPSPGVPQHPSPIVASFDVDASGGITFDEWLLFEALLSIPETDVEVAFALMDVDGNGGVDKQEFGNVLKAIQSRASKPTGTLRQGAAALHLASAQGGLVAAFFGADGKKELSPAVFKKFLADLREEMARLEFQWYDHRGAGAIAARDFALSVVGCAKLKHMDEYLDKIDAMPEALASKTVSYADFEKFRGVWRRLRRLAVALDFWRQSSGQDWTPADFVSVVQRVMGVTLAPAVVDVIFYLFDSPDGAGGLNTHFMLAVMDRHFETGPKFLGGRGGGGGAQGAAQRSFFECISECSRKR